MSGGLLSATQGTLGIFVNLIREDGQVEQCQLVPAPAPGPPPSLPMWFGGDAGAYPPDAFLGPWLPNASVTAQELVTCTIKAPRDGTLQNLRFGQVAGGVVAANDAVLVVRVNQADTALTCTCPVGSNAASDLADTVPVLANADISITIRGTPTLGSVGWATLELV